MARDEIQITLTEADIEKLKLLKESDADPLTANKPLIRKVPRILHSCYGDEDYERYFQPTFVAIGPLNHQREANKGSRIQRGEECKLKLAKMFIEECGGQEEDFYKNVKKEIDSLRTCYNFEQEWTNEELALMFLVDGCALLLFIFLYVDDKWEEFRVNNGLVGIAEVDFFLLENQLPYQLLKILIDSSVEAMGNNDLKKLFKDYITDFINRSFLSLIAPRQHRIQVDNSQPHLSHEQQEKEEEEEDPVHLLDLLRRRLMGVKSKKKGAEKQERINKDHWLKTVLNDHKSRHQFSIRNAKELKDNGIRFKAREEVDRLTKIEFNDRCCMPTLKLAPIFLHNTTMPLLLNLMAYELCPDFKEDCNITSHLSFLNSLIDNSEDVKELRDAGVLHHGLGSDEAVAELFNKISSILVPNLKMDSELRHIQEYCSNTSHPRNQCASFVAKLTDTYFSSPWSFLVFLGALTGLIMTGIQTYNSFQGDKLPY